MINILLLPFMCLSLAQEGTKDEITCDCQGTFKAYTNLKDIMPLVKENE